MGSSFIDDEEQVAVSLPLDGKTPMIATADIKNLVFRLRAANCEFKQAQLVVEALAHQHNLGEYITELYNYLDDVYTSTKEVVLLDRVIDYVESTQGYFNTTDMDRELKIETPGEKANRRQILHRLVQKEIIERHPAKNGYYRRVEHESTPIEWEAADISEIFNIALPFELENYALLYPRNIAVVTGSPDAGKTAFLLDLAKRNRDKHTIHYYSSEMAETELKVRLSKHVDIPLTEWRKIDFRERSGNYADAIAQHPDDLNIIDYFEFSNAEFYLIGSELRAIYDVLRKGICFVALQKKRGADLGRGAEFSLEKPRLYLSMDSGFLKIIKAKNWAVEGRNPNGMEFHFKLVHGAKFIETKEK